ncbi:carboxylesterase/lipase family protein (plasmid) [Coraliomargarita sp. W4R53]
MTDSQIANPTLDLSAGTVRGFEADGIRRFLNVPYARPPFGDRRFRPAERVEAWKGERDATKFGATAPQSPYEGETAKLLTSVKIAGDDILTVNVWTPTDARLMPVMVWFHGGAFERGTPALSGYDGTAFARDGVVFVSVAYRLGSEGFSDLAGAERNLGVSDAAAALAWIHEEISRFGGDPARLTIVGESAGGAIVAALLARKDSAKLAAGAIIESGPLVAESAKRSGRVTRALAKRLGVRATRDSFSAFTPEQLLAARREQSAGGTPLGGAPSFTLAVDPVTLPMSPHQALKQVNIPVLIGTNTDEYRLWFPPAALESITRLKMQLGSLALGVSRRAVKAYRRTLPEVSTGELFGQIATDVLLRKAMVDVADARSAATYVYEFSWQSPVRSLGAAHSIEIGFAFDQLDCEDSVRLVGTNPPQALADRMHADWVRFVHTGDPGWPKYEGDRAVQLYNLAPSMSSLPRAEAIDALSAPRVR